MNGDRDTEAVLDEIFGPSSDQVIGLDAILNLIGSAFLALKVFFIILSSIHSQAPDEDLDLDFDTDDINTWMKVSIKACLVTSSLVH